MQPEQRQQASARVLPALALLGAIGLTCANAAGAGTAVSVGEPFPMLRLRSLDGEVRTISDFRGKKIVLHVFASW